jgi:hypothetical protein
VFSRYLFHAPTKWAFDASYMLYSTLFMFAKRLTLSRNGHVRGDFLISPGSQDPGEDGSVPYPVLLPRHPRLVHCGTLKRIAG